MCINTSSLVKQSIVVFGAVGWRVVLYDRMWCCRMACGGVWQGVVVLSRRCQWWCLVEAVVCGGVQLRAVLCGGVQLRVVVCGDVQLRAVVCGDVQLRAVVGDGVQLRGVVFSGVQSREW